MSNESALVMVLLISACSLGLPGFAQTDTSAQQSKSDQQFSQENNRAPAPGENLPIKGSSELDYVTPEYMGLKKFWSDDAPVALATLGILGAACGAGYMILKKKKK